MKTCLLLFSLTIVQFFSSQSRAYILPIETILGKTAARAGNSIISIEQDVIFSEGSKNYVIHEEWLIEGDKNLKLTATGTGELKDLFKAHYIYNNKNRTQIVGKNKIVNETSREFFEKFLAIKSGDSYLTYLKDLGIAQKVRLSRADGSICFAIGEASTDKALSPQVWIDQDFFRLKKIRLPSEAEIEFSDYKEYGNLNYPDVKHIDWADKSATIRVTKVSTKTGEKITAFYPETLTEPSEIMLSSKGAVGMKIEEFYKRFR
ncbi:hypothetical protein K2P97_06935 [bacterium]|nr:hypothetical protein [bacterium]